MKQKELCTELKNYVQIRDFIEGLLNRKTIDERTRFETMLVFEALYNDMLEKGVPEATMVTVWGKRSFGDLKIKLGFDGSIYVPMSDLRDGSSVEDKVMLAYAEKIENRYHSGRNHIVLTAKRSSLRLTRHNLGALLLAVVVYFPIVALVEKTGEHEIVNEYIFQIEKLFTDAILCVGAPVTFFSLLRNLTSMFIVAEGNSGMRRLESNAIGTSVISIVLAIVTCYIAKIPFMYVYSAISGIIGGGNAPQMSLNVGSDGSDIVDSVVAPTIFESFTSFAPFPIILLAILTTYALCSAGSYFESISKVIEGCYVLFSKMLSAVMYTLPFFCFVAILDVMLKAGARAGIFLFCMTIFAPLLMVAMMLFYSVRLMSAGINPGPFAKTLLPFLKQNLIINSTIDALPYNTRFCVTKYGLNRKHLDDSLPILARVNLNGNCFIITLIAIMFILINNGADIAMFDVIVIGIVVFFLSLGAPNQPGSILIGLLVIISYLHISQIVSLAIYSEALFGGILSMTNAAGDIVTVAIADKRGKIRAARAEKHSQ